MSKNQHSEEDLKQLLELAHKSEHSELVQDILNTTLRLLEDGTVRGDLKIINTALKELRYSFKVFSPYRHIRKVSIFGSARTPENHPDYIMAKQFAAQIVEAGWMVITGAASGIMQAGHEGAGRDKSFGVNIRLPFEQKSNTIIENDAKLINYKYFFTRKLIFIKESDAIVLFPGGFGTHDEGFEALTLVQTGKSPPRPVVMVAPSPNSYWTDWMTYIQKHFLGNKLISAEDFNLFKITDSVDGAANEILQFYKVYHSSRFVKNRFVIRLNKEISDQAIETLNQKFHDLLVKGKIKKSLCLEEESNETELKNLPRLLLYFNRRSWGRLRQMINDLNTL